MNQSQTLEEIMQRIRAEVSGTETSTAGSRTSPRLDGDSRKDPHAKANDPAAFQLKLHELSQLKAEIRIAADESRQVGQLNPRNPGLVNAAIQFVKKVMRRSLTWYTRPLHQFQGGIVRAFDQVYAILDNHNESFRKISSAINEQRNSVERAIREEGDSLANKLASVVDKLASVESSLAESKQEANAIQHELQKIKDQSREASNRSRAHERDVRRTLHEIQAGEIVTQIGAATPDMFPSKVTGDKEFDYFAFEDLYRGDEADIRGRQREYLEYFRGRQDVVDIGCGRGEFLELLRENQIRARGIELGLDQYLLCKEKGLDVIKSDLFTFLESLPDESLGGLFSAQVIEHMTASDQLRYVLLAYQKTQPGSPVIFETINAQCVYAVMRNFFLDPTHVRPMHPETLKFAMETTGFKNVEIKFSGPVSDKQIPPLLTNSSTPEVEAFNRAVAELNQLIYGYQDYAAIGWK